MLFTWLKTLNKLNRHVNEWITSFSLSSNSVLYISGPMFGRSQKRMRCFGTSALSSTANLDRPHLQRLDRCTFKYERTPNSNLIIYWSLQLIVPLNVCCKTRGSVHVTIENNIDLNIWGHGTELEFHYVTIMMGVFASSCTLIDRHVTGEVSSEIRKFSMPGLMLLENHR